MKKENETPKRDRKAYLREWRKKHPGYDKKRYRNDVEFRKKHLASALKWQREHAKQYAERQRKWRGTHPVERLLYHRKWRRKNRPAIRKYARVYHRKRQKNDPVYRRKRVESASRYFKTLRGKRAKWRARIHGDYNISAADYKNLLAKQHETCAICRKLDSAGRRLAVDHDHKTGEIRGLLCGHCNRGLGFFRDNPETLQRAIDYLNDRRTHLSDPRTDVS